MTPAKQVVILKIEHYIENSNFYIMVSSYHNYLNLHIRCLVDALVRLQTQYGSWTPKNGDLPPKYVLVLKTLFYGTILEGVKMVWEIFLGARHPVVVCVVFAVHTTRMHAKSADQTPPNGDLPPKYLFAQKMLYYGCYFLCAENGWANFLWMSRTRLWYALCLQTMSLECMQNPQTKLPQMTICHPNTWLSATTKSRNN